MYAAPTLKTPNLYATSLTDCPDRQNPLPVKPQQAKGRGERQIQIERDIANRELPPLFSRYCRIAIPRSNALRPSVLQAPPVLACRAV